MHNSDADGEANDGSALMRMTGPVERVARAICEAERMNPDDQLGGWVHWTEAAEAAIGAVSEDLEFKIARLDLRPGDILVLKVPQHLSDTQHMRMQEVVKRIDPNLRVLILEKGMDLAMLTAAEIAERAA